MALRARLRKSGICIALLAIFSLLYPSPSWAQRQITVSKIVITNIGPPAMSDSMVRANIRVREGESYNRNAIDDDIVNLHNTGYFYTIRVAEERGPDGISLLYVLQGKPRLTDIVFSGNKKYRARKLRKKLTSKVGEPLDERKLFTDAEEIKKLYQKAGYTQTEVRYVPNIDERAGRGSVRFEITEPPKVKIDDVYFKGAQAFSQRKLRKVIKTRRRWMFSWITGSGVLKDEQLDDDREKLADYYRERGYIDFELIEVRYLYFGPRKLALEFVINEGQRYRVGAVSFQGTTLFTTNEMVRRLKMGVGEIFTPKGLTVDIDALQDLYGAKGHIPPDTRIIARKLPNPQTGTMDLVYEVEEGDKSYIEKIEIKGNTKTKDRVIRRELAVSPGEVFDMVKVKLSKQRLDGTQLFERVETQPEPTDVPNRKNLVVSVAEANTGHFSVGAGFSSIDSILGFVEYTEGNFQLPWFRGGGQKLRLRAALGSVRREYQVTLIEPWFTGRKLSASVDLYHREFDFVSLNDLYNERRTGARFGLTKALGSDFLIGGVSYTIENVGIIDVSTNAPLSIQQEEGDRIVSKVGASLAYDTRKYDYGFVRFLPVGGQRTELRGEVAGGPFGGDTDFYKLELGSSWYLKGFYTGHILEFGGRVGVVNEYGDSPNVPLFDRFFLGGLDTLRGYRWRAVGPRDRGPTGIIEQIGGKTYWFGSLEYSIPIIEYLRIAAFYDIGMVYPKEFSFDPQAADTARRLQGGKFYNDNWGLGVRLNIPQLGPLRLDYGIPITSDKENRSSGRFQFSVGYTREF